MRSGPRSLWTESDPDHYILQLSPSLYFGVAFLFFGVSLWRVRGRHQGDAQNQGVGQQIIGRNPQD